MTNAPHIVLDALLVGPHPTGVGRSILELTRALAERERSLTFTVLVTHPDPFDFLAGRSEWSVVPCRQAAGSTWRKALFTQFALPGLCRRLKADLLHSLQFIVPLRCPCRRVVTVHDLAWKSHAGILQTSRRLYYDALVPRSLAVADAVVTNSESTAREVRDFLPAHGDRVFVTPFGTPSWVWEMKELPPAPNRERYFLFVGTLEPRKNLERLLLAFEQFHAECVGEGRDLAAIPGLKLAGARGWNDGPLRRRMRGLASRGLLEVLDYCPPPRLWELYSRSSGLVFPSLQEGFGFPILEAMAAGCPVLTSDRGAMREVAGEQAVFVEPEDLASLRRGLQVLAWDAEGNRTRRDAGRVRARMWDWSRTADATCEVYRRVLE